MKNEIVTVHRTSAIGTWRNLYGRGLTPPTDEVNRRGVPVLGLNKKKRGGKKG